MKKNNPISLMTFPFSADIEAGRISIECFLEGLRKIGYDGVEVFQSDLTGNPDTARRYRQAMKANGLALACLDIICDLVSRDPRERTAAGEYIKTGITLAHELGCDQGMVVGSLGKPGISPAEARSMIADGLAPQIEFAVQAGVTLMIEDFGMDPEIQCRAEDCLAVLTRAARPKAKVKFTFDTGNFLFAGEDPRVNLEKLLPQTHHVHFKAWRPLAQRRPEDSFIVGDYIGCPLDQGIIPNAELLARILATGYDRWLSVECGAMVDPLATAARDFNALKSWYPFRGGKKIFSGV